MENRFTKGNDHPNASRERTPFYTNICRLLNIQYPIIQGALGGIGCPRLVAAVSNAGGLGVLQTWGLSLEKLRDMIHETKKLTKRPFAVNIIPINAKFTRTRAELIVDEGIGIATTGRGDPRKPIVSFLKSHNLTVIGVVPSVRHALRLEAEGVDAVKVPVVAGGGIADYRGFVAALALGASGIQMGTRFVATVECQATQKQKERIIQAMDEDSVVTNIFTGKPVRVLPSTRLHALLREISTGISLEALRPQIVEIRRIKRNRPDLFISIASGQGAGLIKGILPAGKVIEQIITEALIFWRQLNPWSLDL